MVSLQAAFSPEEEKTCPGRLENFLPKKRKCRDGEENVECLFAKEMKLEKEEDIELNIDAPLPLDWQRCLDIKSGEIHFYNTRMHRRTSRDPRLSLEPLSLDLELNLACKPPSSHGADEGGGGGGEKTKQHDHVCSKSTCNSKEDDSRGRKSSSNLTWMMRTTASEDDADPEEMVATVCMRCHMLVMMSRATLSCPNCKFLHPPNHSSSTLMMMMMKKKPAVKLLCCKD